MDSKLKNVKIEELITTMDNFLNCSLICDKSVCDALVNKIIDEKIGYKADWLLKLIANYSENKVEKEIIQSLENGEGELMLVEKIYSPQYQMELYSVENDPKEQVAIVNTNTIIQSDIFNKVDLSKITNKNNLSLTLV